MRRTWFPFSIFYFLDIRKRCIYNDKLVTSFPPKTTGVLNLTKTAPSPVSQFYSNHLFLDPPLGGVGVPYSQSNCGHVVLAEGRKNYTRTLHLLRWSSLFCRRSCFQLFCIQLFWSSARFWKSSSFTWLLFNYFIDNYLHTRHFYIDVVHYWLMQAVSTWIIG